LRQHHVPIATSALSAQELQNIFALVPFSLTDQQKEDLMKKISLFSKRDLETLRNVLRIREVTSFVELKSIVWDIPTKSILSQTVERTKWDDIGGYQKTKRLLEQSVLWFHKHSEKFQKLGIKPSIGTLLYGPPGCGKTMIARAIANESGANFYAASIPDIVCAEVGESEKVIANLFRTAKQNAPSVIFIDEIESLFMSRENASDISSKVIPLDIAICTIGC
jgi:SpoVK/Ycf46/Vps4 family AAA+-type ATPase